MQNCSAGFVDKRWRFSSKLIYEPTGRCRSCAPGAVGAPSSLAAVALALLLAVLVAAFQAASAGSRRPVSSVLARSRDAVSPPPAGDYGGGLESACRACRLPRWARRCRRRARCTRACVPATRWCRPTFWACRLVGLGAVVASSSDSAGAGAAAGLLAEGCWPWGAALAVVGPGAQARPVLVLVLTGVAVGCCRGGISPLLADEHPTRPPSPSGWRAQRRLTLATWRPLPRALLAGHSMALLGAGRQPAEPGRTRRRWSACWSRGCAWCWWRRPRCPRRRAVTGIIGW